MKLPQLPTRASCTSCELHEHAHSVGTPTIIDGFTRPIPPTAALLPKKTNPAIVFIGQNPGANEDDIGIPFIGMSGAHLRGCYLDPSNRITLEPTIGDWQPASYIDSSEANLRPLTTIYYTNAVRCHTLSNGTPGLVKHLRPCSAHLTTDLQTILNFHSLAKVIFICTGLPASKALLRCVFGLKLCPSQRSLFKTNGNPTYKWHSRTIAVFHTYHPAAVLRDTNRIHAVSRHLRLVRRYLTGEMATPSSPTIVPPFPPSKWSTKCQPPSPT